jgi:hypothetical protein
VANAVSQRYVERQGKGDAPHREEMNMNFDELRRRGKIRSEPASTKHTIRENAVWLKTHMEEYQDQSVALLQGVLLDHDADYKALYDRIKDHPEAREIMLMQIPDFSRW